MTRAQFIRHWSAEQVAKGCETCASAAKHNPRSCLACQDRRASAMVRARQQRPALPVNVIAGPWAAVRA